MTLHLYNTLTRTKEAFAPLDPSNVRMYVCGPTVYDYAHIGNARPVIVFDLLFRLLRHQYGNEHVKYVRNITDVDDRINQRAKERGISIRELTETTARIYQEDARALGCLDPTYEPRVTDHIPEIVTMIAALTKSNAAYEAEGHVLFHVPSKADYGKLARRSTGDMIAGARVDVAPYKKHPMDFVLWKPSSPEMTGWDSPWGRGRPGWHIECSAMGEKLLGETFDIHGGGIDLVFPHHENELAQSECAHGGKPLARVWMHNGHLNMEGEKMSKSLGNFITINELLKDWPGDVLRLNMLKTHYRQPTDWTLRGVEESARILSRWKDAVATYGINSIADYPTCIADYPNNFIEALEDDLNTPLAIKELHAASAIAFGVHVGDEAEASSNLKEAGKISSTKLYRGAQLLGIDLLKKAEIDASLAPRVEKLIAARAAARKAKNFAEADRIRGEITKLGVAIEDGPTGTTWKIVK